MSFLIFAKGFEIVYNIFQFLSIENEFFEVEGAFFRFSRFTHALFLWPIVWPSIDESFSQIRYGKHDLARIFVSNLNFTHVIIVNLIYQKLKCINEFDDKKENYYSNVNFMIEKIVRWCEIKSILLQVVTITVKLTSSIQKYKKNDKDFLTLFSN